MTIMYQEPGWEGCVSTRGSSWRRPPEKMKWLADDGRIWWGKKETLSFRWKRNSSPKRKRV